MTVHLGEPTNSSDWIFSQISSGVRSFLLTIRFPTVPIYNRSFVINDNLVWESLVRSTLIFVITRTFRYIVTFLFMYTFLIGFITKMTISNLKVTTILVWPCYIVWYLRNNRYPNIRCYSFWELLVQPCYVRYFLFLSRWLLCGYHLYRPSIESSFSVVRTLLSLHLLEYSTFG